MSGLLKTKKLNINFQSSGSFLNINKPKLLSLGKSYKINNICVKKNEHNISQDTFNNANITRQTESSSKDEIIRALKERLTILEKKVRILEMENKDNVFKKNLLNLSHGNNKVRSKNLKLNIRIFKNKKKNKNTLNISNSENEKKENICKSYMYKKQKSINNNIKNIKKFSRNLNFFDSINTSGNNTNIDKMKNKIGISNSIPKYKNFTIIPKNSKKKKIFVDLLKKKLIRFETIENEKKENINDNNYILNTNIPKFPKKEKYITKSEKINKYSSKLNEIKTKNSNDKGKKISLFNKYIRKKTCDINNIHHMKLETNFNNNNNSLQVFKNKLDNIKNRTINLLKFYSDNKINNINLTNN